MTEPIEISKGVYIVDLKKFTDIYNARKDLLPILSEGVNERMEQLKKYKMKNSHFDKTIKRINAKVRKNRKRLFRYVFK